jgi:hypothetical protein
MASRAPTGPVGWRIDVEHLQELRRAIRRLSPEAARELNRELRALASVVAAEARSAAPRGKSGKLAASVKPTVQMRRVGIISKHPAARPFHFGIRHPLFGNRNFWFAQPKRPFMFEVADRHREEFLQKAAAAITETWRRLT